MVILASSNGTDVTDITTFYDLWQAFATLRGMCVRYDKVGKMSGIGSEGRLTMMALPFG